MTGLSPHGMAMPRSASATVRRRDSAAASAPEPDGAKNPARAEPDPEGGGAAPVGFSAADGGGLVSGMPGRSAVGSTKNAAGAAAAGGGSPAPAVRSPGGAARPPGGAGLGVPGEASSGSSSAGLEEPAPVKRR